jgi:hypothetical protein
LLILSLEPKNAMDMSVTGTTSMVSLTRLITINATTNSAGRSGLISRLEMLRDHIDS